MSRPLLRITLLRFTPLRFRLYRFTFCVLLLTAACGTLSPPGSSASPSTTLDQTDNGTAAAAGESTPPATEPVRDLRVWLPVRFDPQADTAAAHSMKARLDLFARLHPEVRLDVRVKDESGPAGLLEMLSLARAAAPDTLPDLVALPRADLEDAALKSIIHPIEGMTESLNGPGWYFYARQLAHVQNSTYGLPFAGDALVLVYDPGKYATPPESWDVILRRPGALVLTGERPQQLFLIGLYRSMNGGLLDAQNRPMLEGFALEPTLSIVERARINHSVFVDTEAAAWDALAGGRAAWIVTTATLALAESSDRFQLAALPGLNEDSFTVGTAWTWALAGSDPRNDSPAIELADWLVNEEFLNAWISQAGYLPVRSAQPNERYPALTTVAESAQPVPSNDVLAALEPVLAEAVTRILGGESLETVSLDAAEALK